MVADISLGCNDGFFNPIKYILSCGYEAYLGCTDVSACNYEPEAVIDDGTCAEIDCQGVCGGIAVSDPVCEVCVDASEALTSIQESFPTDTVVFES